MPPRKKSALSKAQRKAMREIAHDVVDDVVEDKQYVATTENIQLFHNKASYTGKYLQAIEQGVDDGDVSPTGNTGNGLQTIRLGSSIRLKNINIRLWLSNKLDRPNVMYKGTLFWYSVNQPPTDATVFKTQSNKMLDRLNTNKIQILDTFIVRSTNNYAVDANNHEHSYLATLNKSWKGNGVKVQYDQQTTFSNAPEQRELGMSIVCYDAYGTLQTDNISSYALQSLITFQDA